MQYLLDTHVLLWWYLDDKSLSARYHSILANDPQEPVAVSAISLWEIAKLVERGKLRLSLSLDECLADVESNPSIEVLPISARVAIESTRLGSSFPRDPADQLIAASARCHGLVLLTGDSRVRDSGVVAVL